MGDNIEVQKKGKVGRPKKSADDTTTHLYATAGPRLLVQYLDLNKDNMEWVEYRARTYADMTKILQDNHGVYISRNILQNAILGRYNRRNIHQNLKVSRIIKDKVKKRHDKKGDIDKATTGVIEF